jgi:hypothetical protein
MIALITLVVASKKLAAPTTHGPAGQHAVWRIQVPALNGTNQLRSFLSTHEELDVWRELRGVGDQLATTDVSIPADAQASFAKYLKTIGATSEVFIGDGTQHNIVSVPGRCSGRMMTVCTSDPSPSPIDAVDALIAQQSQDMAQSLQEDKTEQGYLNVSRYHSNEEIYPWLAQLPIEFPELVTRVVVGRSVLGREMIAIKLSKGGAARKPALWMDGGLHCREWVTTAVQVWMLDHILNNQEDRDVAKLLDSVDL